MSDRSLFPPLNDVFVIRKRSKDRKRSVWLGTAVLLLNLPRLLIRSLWTWFRLTLLLSVASVYILFVEVVIGVIRDSIYFVYLGLRGLLADKDSEEVQRAKDEGFEPENVPSFENGTVDKVIYRVKHVDRIEAKMKGETSNEENDV